MKATAAFQHCAEAGLPELGIANPQTPAPLMILAKTVRGRSSAMTSESGSVMSGLIANEMWTLTVDGRWSAHKVATSKF